MALPLQFAQFSDELIAEIEEKATVKIIPAGIEIVHEGQYIQALPLVTKGRLKVFSRHLEREFLLYYIQPNESCIMSFYGVLNQTCSKIIAQTETETELILLPSTQVPYWLKRFPEFSIFFHTLNNLRYNDLLKTINEILFENLDKRILSFLQEKAQLNGNPFVKIKHREIADALGTSREVISRVTKKLELEKQIEQYPDGIEVRL
jgi:CRP/FNR family transcriptional regulator, anaerobic regulatory protein